MSAETQHEVYVLTSKQGKVAYFRADISEYALQIQLKSFRAAHHGFAYKRAVKTTFKRNYFAPPAEDGMHYLFYRYVYESYEVTEVIKAWEKEYEESQQVFVRNEFHPVARDFVLLRGENGRHTEDFTYIAEYVREEADAYVVKDMYGKEMRVEPLPERDSGTRKAWKQLA